MTRLDIARRVACIIILAAPALSHSIPHPSTQSDLEPASPSSPSTRSDFSRRFDVAFDQAADLFAGLFGFSSSAEDSLLHEEGLGLDNAGPGGLAAFSESSVWIERTNSLHPSRPSAFGPHLSEPLHSFLFPIEVFTSPSDSHGCTSLPSNHTPPEAQGWVALIERGKCPFSHKIRTAQFLGAEGVVFGDMAIQEGGIGVPGGLLTPWSPDDTADITIPSSFVSRASYLNLLKTWDEEQEVVDLHNDTKPALRGLSIIMSRDEVFVWPLLDLLLLLLFLPSILTLITVITQRIRILRQQKLDRAPADLVAKLPVFTWGAAEKVTPEQGDEEAQLESLQSPPPRPADHPEPTERTSLLPRASGSSPLLVPPTRVSRLLSYLGLSRRPTKKEYEIAKQARTFAGSGTLTECAICLCEFEKGDVVMQLPCGHIFHKEEIEGWLIGTKRVCPVCRASISPDEQEASLPPPQSPTSVTPIINIPHTESAGEQHAPIASSSGTHPSV